ncbi:hypothetical protein AAVH_10988 [Aphelenchoides avenae]|nr:hypothetical protein AAVH_10988 [Aphelenchus avenae]
MLRVRLKFLLLITAHLPLMCAELSQTEETSSVSARDKGKPDSCGKDCEDHRRVRKRSTLEAKCELYYFVPTAKQGETFAFWNNTRAEQVEAYYKILPFLQTNPHEKPIFFPAHLPLVEKRNGSEVLVLKDVYVRAKGTCGLPLPGCTDYYDTNPAWYKNADLRLQEELKMLEDYIQLMPRSHFGYRVPTDGEDACLDETGLVVKDFPNVRTCFSMWIFDDADQKPKHFAGRQIYNRINQQQHVNISAIGFNPSKDEYLAEPISTDMFSLPALFLKEMCEVTSISLPNRCAYWASDRFYVSLCCCYTNRRECAYRKYKFPAEKKEGDPVIRACATGDYYVMKDFGGTREPRNASGSSVKQFVQERTSSEFCKWTYTWNTSQVKLEDALRVDLDAAAAITDWMKDCAGDGNSACCQPTNTLCPMDPIQATEPIVVECVCVDGDMCNKRRSYVDKGLVRKFRKARPCETHTAYEHLLSLSDDYKKPETNLTNGYMCPVFYNFAYPARKDRFLQLVAGNNLDFPDENDIELFQEEGCYLVEVTIAEDSDCPEKLLEQDNGSSNRNLLIMICSVEGNPLGENRTSYPDAELKKTIATNLTAAKEAFPTCKNGSWSLDFESISELVMDNSKLEHMFSDIPNGTNDNITTVHCFVDVKFAYQQQYDFTFGAEALLGQLKALLNENAIAQKPQDIMTELKRDPLTKCAEANEGHAATDVNRPCARNEGCYTGVHARDVRASTQHKKFGGCISKDAPDAKKRDNEASNEVEARFYRICRLLENDGQCFAVIGTEDPELPDDVKGPQIVCCCKGQVGSTHKCGSSHKMGAKIGDLV